MDCNLLFGTRPRPGTSRNGRLVSPTAGMHSERRPASTAAGMRRSPSPAAATAGRILYESVPLKPEFDSDCWEVSMEAIQQDAELYRNDPSGGYLTGAAFQVRNA